LARFDQIFGQVFGQVFDQVFDQIFDHVCLPGFWEQKIQCTVIPGRRKSETNQENKNYQSKHISES